MLVQVWHVSYNLNRGTFLASPATTVHSAWASFSSLSSSSTCHVSLHRHQCTETPHDTSTDTRHSVREKAWLIFRATRTHARNLAKFATIYKLTCLILKNFGPTPGKEGDYDSLVAGLVGGYMVFGRRSRSGRISSVNQQIVIYVFARVVLALAKLSVREGSPFALPVVSKGKAADAVSYYAWPVFASASWGMVMWLFRWHAEDLQPSLRSSMSYIYAQSDHWDGLRNFAWHNK